MRQLLPPVDREPGSGLHSEPRNAAGVRGFRLGPTGRPGPGFPTRTKAVADQYVVFLMKEEAPVNYDVQVIACQHRQEAGRELIIKRVEMIGSCRTDWLNLPAFFPPQ